VTDPPDHDAGPPPPIEHVVVHVRDALATDARVGELGLDVEHRDDGIVVRGAITNAARRAGIVPVAREVLDVHGYDLDVHDETTLTSTDAPTTEPERL
jgi:hypothetical protein